MDKIGRIPAVLALCQYNIIKWEWELEIITLMISQDAGNQQQVQLWGQYTAHEQSLKVQENWCLSFTLAFKKQIS